MGVTAKGEKRFVGLLAGGGVVEIGGSERRICACLCI